MAAAPIYNPVVPCVYPIPGGMYPGRMLRVQGSTPAHAQRFAINLQCGPNTDPRDDIALHLNFRFPERCVVRNHLSALAWGSEELGGGLPLAPGQAFEALVLCEAASMKVALNGAHFCEFSHRLAPGAVSHVTVDGDVMLQLIGFEGAAVAAQAYAQPQQPSYGAPPPYAAQGYGAPPVMMSAPPMMQQPQQYPQYGGGAAAARGGLGAGAATGIGVGALAAGGLAGYALAGGFSSDDHDREEVNVAPPVEDFGGDDWME